MSISQTGIGGRAPGFIGFAGPGDSWSTQAELRSLPAPTSLGDPYEGPTSIMGPRAESLASGFPQGGGMEFFPANNDDDGGENEQGIKIVCTPQIRTREQADRTGKDELLFFDRMGRPMAMKNAYTNGAHYRYPRPDIISLGALNAYLASDEGRAKYGVLTDCESISRRWMLAGAQVTETIVNPDGTPTSSDAFMTILRRGQMLFAMYDYWSATGIATRPLQTLHLILRRFEMPYQARGSAAAAAGGAPPAPQFYWQWQPWADVTPPYDRPVPSEHTRGYNGAVLWRGRSIRIGTAVHVYCASPPCLDAAKHAGQLLTYPKEQSAKARRVTGIGNVQVALGII